MRSLATLLLIFTCAFPAKAGNESLEQLGNAFVAAVLAGDMAALAATYAPDATFYPMEGSVVQGRAAIREAWRGFFRGRKVASFEASQVKRYPLGDAVVSSGLWTMTLVSASGAFEEVQGRFMDLAGTIDGQWFYLVDHASVAQPGP